MQVGQYLEFHWTPKSVDYLTNVAAIDVSLHTNCDELSKNIDVFKLNELYEVHKDTAQEVLKKKHMYNDSKVKELYEDYPDLFKNELEVKNLIFGAYLEDETLGKRSLSKLIHDIYKNETNRT